jgi:hypothetical protein
LDICMTLSEWERDFEYIYIYVCVCVCVGGA